MHGVCHAFFCIAREKICYETNMGSNEIQNILTELAHHRDLSAEAAQHAFQIIMNGGATPAQMGAFLMGLRQKGETVTEITAGAQILRHKVQTFAAPDNAIDTCGTGGDGKRTFNISTTVAIVLASCGVPVVKHGNRGVTSASGSSDILKALGVVIDAPADISQYALKETNLCFLMAPLYHKAMRHIAPIRQELGLRTIFNLLGPLANPAGTKKQLLGVYDKKWARPLAETLRNLGATHAWVVHGDDGMDEITTTTTSHIVTLHQGKIREFTLDPHDYGISYASEASLAGGLPEENATALHDILSGKWNAYADIVMLNAAAALTMAESCEDMHEGCAIARQVMENGSAKRTLAAFIEATKLKSC
jgi:anthranilate phosphoribosyltransferase